MLILFHLFNFCLSIMEHISLIGNYQKALRQETPLYAVLLHQKSSINHVLEIRKQSLSVGLLEKRCISKGHLSLEGVERSAFFLTTSHMDDSIKDKALTLNTSRRDFSIWPLCLHRSMAIQ